MIGRLQYDLAAFSQNTNSIASAGDMKNGTEFRRRTSAWSAIASKWSPIIANAPSSNLAYGPENTQNIAMNCFFSLVTGLRWIA